MLRWAFTLGIFMATFMLPSISYAGSNLVWDESSGDVSGYRIYYGTSQGSHNQNIDVGNATQYSLSSLPLNDNTTYYFIVRAYNDAGESGNSNEISWKAGDNTPPLPPKGITVE